jgi:hypothetical protein
VSLSSGGVIQIPKKSSSVSHSSPNRAVTDYQSAIVVLKVTSPNLIPLPTRKVSSPLSPFVPLRFLTARPSGSLQPMSPWTREVP